jgi:stalled ribosome rescue protein Dom34
MAGNTRMTIYLQPKVFRALKVKSATTDRSVSELVNAAVMEALREDAIDVEVFDKRYKESTRSFEQVLKDLKRDGLL